MATPTPPPTTTSAGSSTRGSPKPSDLATLHPRRQAARMSELHATPVGSSAPITAIDEGQGPTLLVVHPGGNDATSWNTVARLLADQFRVVRIHRRIYAARASI